MNQDLGQSLLRYNWKNYNFFVFDFETCSLNTIAPENKPWEIGYITIERGEVTQKKLRRLYWKDLNVSEDAARITGFNLQDYESTAEPPEDILGDIEGFIEDDGWVVMDYNGLNFDIYIYNILRRLCGRETSWNILNRHIDTLALARAYRLEENLENIDNPLDFLFWQTKLSKHFTDPRTRREKKKGVKGASLEVLCREFECVPDGPFHSGLNDVVATWNLFEKLMWKFDLTTKHLEGINSQLP